MAHSLRRKLKVKNGGNGLGLNKLGFNKCALKLSKKEMDILKRIVSKNKQSAKAITKAKQDEKYMRLMED